MTTKMTMGIATAADECVGEDTWVFMFYQYSLVLFEMHGINELIYVFDHIIQNIDQIL